MYDPRIDKLADVMVAYSLEVKKGDVVRIKASTTAMPLIEALTKRVLKAGGHPLIRVQAENADEILYRYGKDFQLAFLSPIDKFELDKIDCHIGIWAELNTKSLSNVDPKKAAIVSKARGPLLDRFLKRIVAKGDARLRWTGTQFPCLASAQDAEMSLEEYAEFVYRAGLLHRANPAADWKKIGERQQRLCDYLNKAKEIRFVSPNGTDLRLGVDGRTWINCAGKQNFPDGEVFTGPIENATEGTVRYSFPAVYHGREVEDATLTFKNGKVVDASASKGEDYLFQMMDQDKGGRILGEIAIGTNYAIRNFTKNTLFDEKIGGTFHAALGAAYPDSGGKNKSALHWDMVCDLRKGGRIEVDGKSISENGRFANKSWPQPVK
jgi:aminopeptidase